MAFAHSFNDVYPPARFDGVAWTRVRVQESAASTGPWTQIADQAIAIDATPETPNPLDITVTTATLERGYFRFQFVDAATNTSPFTDAVFSPAAVGGDARAWLVGLVAPTLEPVLTDADLDDLLLRARRTDSAGLAPTDASWTPTYDVESAASEGWLIRAGRAADAIDFGEDGQRFNASKVFDQSMAMHRHYRRSSGSVTISSAVSA